MTAEQLLIENWRVLPADKQQQAIDFIRFLRAEADNTDLEEKTTQRRRTPPPELEGSVKILGDIVSPILDEEELEYIEESWKLLT
ncbi:MAG: hypothetical protein AAFV85_25485 [Cyanobacteria bacterium J06634_6]